MLHTINRFRRVFATAMTTGHRVAGRLVIIGTVAAAAGAGQPTAPRQPDPAALGVLGAESDLTQPPSPARTIAAFTAVRTWVRSWGVPEDAEALAGVDERGQPNLPAVYGACVVLRLHGQAIGRGTAIVESGVAGPQAALLTEATRKAIEQADARLPVPNDLNRAEAVRMLTGDIQISLELAAAPTPIVGDAWSEVDSMLSPGLDGLMVRVGQGPVQSAFPSTAILSGLLPQKSLRGLVSNAIGESGATEVLRPLGALRETHQLGLWRFRVSHIAQLAPGAEPEFLFRGARLIRLGQIDAAELNAFARAAVGRLVAQLAMAEKQAEPQASDIFGESIATFSLLRYAEYSGDAALRDAADRALRRLGGLDLGAMANGQGDKHHSALSAAVLLSATAACDGALRHQAGARVPSPSHDELPEACRIAESLVTPAFQCFLPGFGFDGSVPAPVRPLVTLSFARAARMGSGHPDLPFRFDADQLNKTARAALGGEMTVTKSSELVGRMPWLGWAALELAPADSDISSAVALRQMRSEIWKHQLTALDAGDDGADMVGGIVFTSGTTSPLPTWQSVRPIAFLATMLGDARLTEPSERPLELARLLQAFRFLRQLQVDDSCGWFSADPAAAVGSIRAATWDQTLPPDATSLGLLAACELLKSMDRIAAGSTAPPPSELRPATPKAPAGEP